MTTDQSLRYQRNLAQRQIGIVVLLDTNWALVRERVQQIAAAIEGVGEAKLGRSPYDAEVKTGTETRINLRRLFGQLLGTHARDASPRGAMDGTPGGRLGRWGNRPCFFRWSRTKQGVFGMGVGRNIRVFRPSSSKATGGCPSSPAPTVGERDAFPPTYELSATRVVVQTRKWWGPKLAS